MRLLPIVFVLASLFNQTAAKIFFLETFTDDAWPSRWTQSNVKKDYGIAKVTRGKFFGDKLSSRGLKTTEDNKFYALISPLDKILETRNDTLVLQFTAKHEQGLVCGGGYIKLLPRGIDASKFSSDTEYNVMFGPDICDGEPKTVALLSGFNGEGKDIKRNLDTGSDHFTHIYTFILSPNKTFVFLFDNVEHASGPVDELWDLVPAKEILDYKKKKPDSWDNREMISDETDFKPEGWDVSQFIPDPSSKQPKDWDVEEYGQWEGVKLINPAYKGLWRPKQIPNPGYQGKWEIPYKRNPLYRENMEFAIYEIGFVAIDIWQVDAGSIFDDIMVTNSIKEAKDYAVKTIIPKMKKEQRMWDKLSEASRKTITKSKTSPPTFKITSPAKKTQGVDDDDDEDNEVESIVDQILSGRSEL